MKKIDATILNLLLDKLKLIADWSYEAEQNGIGDAITTVISQIYENLEA